MDLFDLLIIAFILLPVLEAIFGKKARQKRKQGGVGRPGAPDGPDRRSRDEEAARPTSAGEMVPDDLWELLTGGRRTRETDTEPGAPASRELEEADRGLESWEADLEPAMEPVEYEPLERRRDDEGPVSEPPSDWLPGKAGERGRPPSEGYSLERTDLPEAYSLETPARPERLRHAAFHRKLDTLRAAPGPRRPAAARDLGLGSVKALRRAVILKEVLGPPKGLR